jgi:hypothetical protein
MSAIMELVKVHPEGEMNESFRFGCGGGRIGVEACADRLTAYGGLAAWSHYVEHLGIVEDLAKRWPVERSSPNATPVRDILHGFMINALMGGRRFAHIRRMQDDRAVAAILGLKRGRVCGEDAFVRMMSRADRERARSWMAASERDLYAALPVAFIADWDSTVNTRYGHQEEVEVGYNPHKPGRGSHHPLLCVVAGTRLALHMEWRPGKAVSATAWQDAMEKVWSHPDVRSGLKLNRGDIGFAQEKIMAWHEEPGTARPHYLFKLRLTRNVKRALARIPWPLWEGQPTLGMEQHAETTVQLQGWSRPRRVVFVRTMKPANPSAQDVFWGMDREEVSAYVTSLPSEEATPGQIVLAYRKRADTENVFDELKNQWGFSGFCSGKAVVSEMAARLLLITYNLWTLFVRVVKEEGVHTEAVTSRDELLLIPAKLVESGRRKTLKLAVSEKWWSAIAQAYKRLQRWLAATAPQLEIQQTFERYLCWHNPLSPDNWLAELTP